MSNSETQTLQPHCSKQVLDTLPNNTVYYIINNKQNSTVPVVMNNVACMARRHASSRTGVPGRCIESTAVPD